MSVESLEESVRAPLNKRWVAIAMALPAAALAIGFVARLAIDASSAPTPRTPVFLIEQAVELNQKLPANVDTRTRLERVAAGPGLKFTYEYTVFREAGDVGPLRLDADSARVRLRAAYCTDMRDFVQAGVAGHWSYRDEAGAPIATVDLAPEVCAPAAAEAAPEARTEAP